MIDKLTDKLMDKSVFISAGEFEDYGGWVLDTQFINTIGTSYLLAHGLGQPVQNAVKIIRIREPGEYHVWAYTKDWAAHRKKGEAPGVFRIKVGEETLDILGNKGEEWGWQRAGSCKIKDSEVKISLVDLTGFEGRCAAVFLTQDNCFSPPDGNEGYEEFRDCVCENHDTEDAGKYDIVIAGGGIAGMSAAVSAASENMKVALIQDRFVLGGNNSSECRVWLGGETNFEPFPGLGNIVRTFEPEKANHYGHENTGEIYEDEKRIEMIKSIPGIDLFLGCCVRQANVMEGSIKSIVFSDVKTNRRKILSADLFVDATGDAALGFAAGARYETTTNGHMGMTNFWYVEDTGKETDFPECPWAIDLSEEDFPGRYAENDKEAEERLGCWYWESGLEHEPIVTDEYARDTNFRAMYGAFDALKNIDGVLKKYKIGFSGYIGGKRESRRLLGDVILTKSELLTAHEFEDGCFPTTWTIDVHYPEKRYYSAFKEGDAFISTAYHERLPVNPYFVPYRCLYSANIANLFMAGRNISVTHDALGTVRVMRTCGMMGEVVGIAAGLCKKYHVNPRDIYTEHLNELIEKLKNL